MEAVISKKVSNIKDAHIRLNAYLDIVELISNSFEPKTEPKSSYLMVTAEKDGIPEGKYLGNKGIEEIREYLKEVKITGIEYSIPGSFLIHNKLWYIQGEGPAMFWNEVSLVCSTLSPEEVVKLKEQVVKSSKDFSIQFGGKKFTGEA